MNSELTPMHGHGQTLFRHRKIVKIDLCARVSAEDKRHVCGILGYDTETIQKGNGSFFHSLFGRGAGVARVAKDEDHRVMELMH